MSNQDIAQSDKSNWWRRFNDFLYTTGCTNIIAVLALFVPIYPIFLSFTPFHSLDLSTSETLGFAHGETGKRQFKSEVQPLEVFS
jgi:hypothetical protein